MKSIPVIITENTEQARTQDFWWGGSFSEKVDPF